LTNAFSGLTAEYVDLLEYASLNVVDHLKLKGTNLFKLVHWHLESQLWLMIMALESALNRELLDFLLGNRLRVGLNLLAALRELRGFSG